MPQAPFSINARDDALEVACIVGDLEKQMTIDATTLRAEHEVGDVFDGPEEPRWELEVGGVYAVTWPTELTLRSWPEPEEPPFFMFEDEVGSLMYVQGPFSAREIPDRDGMVGEGQREVGRGEDGELRWLDLGYDHHDEPWRQRHVLVPLTDSEVLVVSGQSRAEVVEAMEGAALGVARSISLRQS